MSKIDQKVIGFWVTYMLQFLYYYFFHDYYEEKTLKSSGYFQFLPLKS